MFVLALVRTRNPLPLAEMLFLVIAVLLAMSDSRIMPLLVLLMMLFCVMLMSPLKYPSRVMPSALDSKMLFVIAA